MNLSPFKMLKISFQILFPLMWICSPIFLSAQEFQNADEPEIIGNLKLPEVDLENLPSQSPSPPILAPGVPLDILSIGKSTN